METIIGEQVEDMLQEIEMTEPESEENRIQFQNTFEITFTITQEGDPDQDLPTGKSDFEWFADNFNEARFRKVRTSPNRIPYHCTNNWCDLRYIHRVGKDDPKLTPAYCAYCARAYDLSNRADQVSIVNQATALEAELVSLRKEEEESDSGDVRNRIDIIKDQINRRCDEARAASRDITLVMGTPFDGS